MEYTQEELEEMTITEIRQLAEELGYELAGSLKAEIIESFLAAQAATQEE